MARARGEKGGYRRRASGASSAVLLRLEGERAMPITAGTGRRRHSTSGEPQNQWSSGLDRKYKLSFKWEKILVIRMH